MSDDAGRTSIVLFGTSLLARVVGFVGLMYFTKVLAPEQLDVYFLFFLLVQVVSLLSNLGLNEAIVRRVSEGNRMAGIRTAALVVVAVVVPTIALVVFGLRGPISAYVGADVPLLLVGGAGLWLLSDVHSNVLRGENRVLTAGVLQLLQDVVRVGVSAALVTTGFGPLGLMYGVLAGFGVGLFGGALTVETGLAPPKLEDFRRLFSISRYTMAFGPTNLVYFWLDTFLIGLWLATGNVSPYEVAWQTVNVLVIATMAINQTILPKVSRWAESGTYDEVERILPGAFLFTLFFPLPGFVGVLVLGEEILSVVYRPSYAIAALPMMVLAGYMIVEAVQRVSYTVLTGLDRADIPFRSRLVGVGIAVVANALLIPEFGLLGAAVATLGAKLVDTVIQLLQLGQLIDIDIPRRALGWELLSAGVMGMTVLAASTVLPGSTYLGLGALVGIGGLTYLFLVLVDDDIRLIARKYSPIPRAKSGLDESEV